MNVGQQLARLEESTGRVAEPSWSGSMPTDTQLLAQFSAAGDRELAALPARPNRDTDEQRRAETVHRRCRRARASFLSLHADHVYAVVTNGRRLRPRVPELTLAAAERFPGLVPTREQMTTEAALPQAAKEGREIDQGLFLSAVLGSALSGAHLMDSMLMPTPRAEEIAARFATEGRVDLGAVLVERRDGTAELTVRNGACLNAEDDELIAQMETAVDLALLDPQIRVCVLRGGVMSHPRYAGRRVFSAGINLQHLHHGKISFTGFLMGRELGYIHKIYRGLLPSSATGTDAIWPHRYLHKPWVAAVDTFAIGGGAQLLLVFDHVLASSEAFFSLPAAQEGIVPGAGGFRLGRHVGARLARQVLLSGRTIWASADAGRLVFDEVVPAAEMDHALDAAVRRLDSPAVIANRRILNTVEEPFESFRAYLAEFALEQALRLYSDDVIAKAGRRVAAKERAS